MAAGACLIGLLAAAVLACNGAAPPSRETAADDEAGAATGASDTGHFISLSDIHFDPLYDPALFAELMAHPASAWEGVFATSTVTALAPAGADSNFNLLVSALRAAGRAGADADFVVISGDFLAHGFQKSFTTALDGLTTTPAAGDCRAASSTPLQCFTDRTLELVALMLRDSFGTLPIYPALGNNDSYCGDYEIDPVGPFVQRTGGTWSRLLLPESAAAAFNETFAGGGYYAAVVPATGARILALNTNLYSTHYRDACALTDPRGRPPSPAAGGAAEAATQEDARPIGAVAPPAAAAQLRWLEAGLEAAARDGVPVYLLYHIPAGIDVYATLAHGSVDEAAGAAGGVGGVIPLWSGEYAAPFVDLVARHAGVIRGILAGHTHMDQFVLVHGAGGAPRAVEHVTPAITPLFGNNPAFERFTYDRDTGVLLDYTTHYLPVQDGDQGTPDWREGYRFSEAYGATAMTPAVMADLWSRLADAGPDRFRFQRYFKAGAPPGETFDGAAWRAYWCGLGTATVEAFAACHSG